MSATSFSGDTHSERVLPDGYRISVRETAVLEKYQHWIGGSTGLSTLCPCCDSELLTGWDLDTTDPELVAIIPWEFPRLMAIVCPNCDMYQEPYWVRFGKSISVVSAINGRTSRIFECDRPYTRLPAKLTRLNACDYPSSAENLHQLVCRAVVPSVYHQIGGTPPFGRGSSMLCCDCHRLMQFTGILDSDPVNLRFLDGGRWEFGLLFGDSKFLAVFACKFCAVIGMRYQAV